jgi:hypothetical protein
MGAVTLSDSPTPQPKHSNLYVSNLPPSLQSEQDITALFAEYGRVETCRLVRNSRDSKSFAFVKLSTIPESLAAIAGLNKKTVGGAVLEVKTADAGEQAPASQHTPVPGCMNNLLTPLLPGLGPAYVRVTDAGDRNPELLAPPSDNLYAKVRALLPVPASATCIPAHPPAMHSLLYSERFGLPGPKQQLRQLNC